MHTYTTPLLVAGLGCVRGCSQKSLEALLTRTMRHAGRPKAKLAALASIDIKHNEPGLLALARALGVPCAFYSAAELLRYDKRLSTRSEAVYRETGCYGVAEAAALAHVERLTAESARLLVPKRKTPEATVALAMGYSKTE